MVKGGGKKKQNLGARKKAVGRGAVNEPQRGHVRMEQRSEDCAQEKQRMGPDNQKKKNGRRAGNPK